MTNPKPPEPRFLFAEESGLALFENRHTGRRFWIDIEHWMDIVECVQSGWEPKLRHRRAG